MLSLHTLQYGRPELYVFEALHTTHLVCLRPALATATYDNAPAAAAAAAAAAAVALQVLFNGITVGDVASWVDSLLVAYLLRFGATSFSRVEVTTCKERQLAYTFQVRVAWDCALLD
jgi:hypothetical protein